MNLVDRVHFIREAWKMTKEPGGFSGALNMLQGILRGEPPRRGTKELMMAYRTMPWLRAVSGRISSAVASTSWHLYVQAKDGGKGYKRNSKAQRGDLQFRQKELKRMKAAGELREIENHPFLDLLDKANPSMTGRSARQVTQTYMDLKGEAFWILERNGYRMPVEYYPIPPHWVISTPEPNKPYFRVSFQGWQGEIPETEIIWMRDIDPLNPYGRGIGITESLMDELETDEYAAKHMKAWFYNRAVPELLIGVEGARQADLDAAKAKWEQDHRSFWKAFGTHWHSGKLTVTQLSQTFAEQQLLQLREWQRDIVQQTFGIPPEIMGIVENSNRATIDAADYLFAKYVTVPRLEILRTEMQEKVVPLFDERLILEYENPVPEDNDFKLKVAQAAPHSRTRNEWRELQGLEPDDKGGDVYPVPIGIMWEKYGEDPSVIEEPPPGAIPPDYEDDEGKRQGKQGTKKPNSGEYKMPSMDDIERLLARMQEEYLLHELSPVFVSLVEQWGAAALADVGVDSAFNIHNPRVSDHLREKENRITRINETTVRLLREELVEGVENGEGVPELAGRVDGVFADARGWRATMISRTEVVGSSNFANYEAFQQSGVVDKIEWIATRDGRTRESHAGLDGDIVVMGNYFVSPVSGATALHPHGFGIAAEDVNCRCTTGAVIDLDEDEDERAGDARRTKKWKEFDAEAKKWEKRVLFGLKRAFQKQHDDIMDELKKI